MISLGLFLISCGSLWAFDPGVIDSFGAPKLLILALGTALLWLGLAERGARKSALDRHLLFFWAALGASALAGADRPVAVFGVFLQEFHGLLLLAILTLIFLGARSASWLTARPFFVSCSIGAVGMGVAVVAQAAGRIPPPFAEMNGRVIGTIGNPVFFAGCLAALLPICVHEVVFRPGVRRWLGVLAVAACVLGLVLSKARGGWLAALAGLWVEFWLLGWLRARAAYLIAAIGLLVGALALGGPLEKATSDLMRLELWKISFAAFRARPWLGWGPDCFVLAMKAHLTPRWPELCRSLQASAHNDLAQVAVTLGVVGLAAYLWLWWGLWRCLRAFQLWQVPPIAAAGGALAALFVQAKTNPLSPSALAIGAVCAAMVSIGPDALNELSGRIKPSRLRWLAFFAASIAALWLQWNQFAAHESYSMGVAAFQRGELKQAAGFYREANERAPWELPYSIQRCDMIWKIAPLADPAARRLWLTRAVTISRDAVALHAQDESARILLAQAIRAESVADKIGPAKKLLATRGKL